MARIRTIKPEPSKKALGRAREPKSPDARSEHIPSDVAAEIRGFFFGEGHLDLVKSGRGKSFTPRARVSVRDDDVIVLEWIRSRLGGSLYHREATRSWCWQLSGSEALTVLLNILSAGYLPSKKREEVGLMMEAVRLTPGRGYHISDADAVRLREIRDELKRVRTYRRPADG